MIQAARRLPKSTSKPKNRIAIIYRARLLRFLGPGLVTGAVDDDPSGIATFSQIGAQFGFTMLWTLVLSYPLMAAIQESSAWIGRVSGAGLARSIRLHYRPWLSYATVGVLLSANVINLAADIAAMADALCLLIGGPMLVYTLIFGGICLAGVVFVSYARFAKVLKFGTLVLLVYIVVTFAVHAPMREIIAGSFIPRISLGDGYMTALTAVL
jgi:NRAMP (natural resistance-associated macrophage protein)-like metal ion transporter